MKSKNLFLIVLLLIATTLESLSQPYYFLVPGTISYRLDGEVQPAFSYPQLQRHSPGYYGYNRIPSGARTPFDSSPYLDFALFRHPTDPNAYTDPSNTDIVQNGTPGAAREDHWVMNLRMTYPNSFDPENPGNDRYPLIIMMHGAGERGDRWNGNSYADNEDWANLWNNDHNLVHGGNQHLVAKNNGRFPGFIVFPQNRSGWVSGNFGDLFASLWQVEVLLEQLMREYPIDPLRIYIHGLSNGGIGAWKMVNTRPDLFAAINAMSGSSLYKGYPSEKAQDDLAGGSGLGRVDPAETIVPIPLRQYQGGKDSNPTPNNTENVLRQIREAGGTPEYFYYSNLGHATWNTAYAEPDFFEWFLKYDKTHIHPFFGVTEVCEGDPIDVKLAVSNGFLDYRWQKDIDGNISDIDLSGASRKDFIQATELGKYRVSIKYMDLYTNTEVWSDWSDWFTLGSRPRPDIEIIADGPVALPGLNNDFDVLLSANTDVPVTNYKWYRNGLLFEEGEDVSSTLATSTNQYHLVVTDENRCDSNPSNSIYVSRTPYSGTLPFAPTNLRVQANTPSSMNLYWDSNSTDELGFEIYRRIQGETTWKWVANTAPGVISYTDNNLLSNTNYCYAIRAYNENGASSQLGPVCALSESDDEAPSPPQNFTFNSFNYFETRLNEVGELADEYLTVEMDKAQFSWEASTDNGSIDRYNIYREDGTLVGTTTETTFLLTGLVAGETHGYYVTAVDGANNESYHSNGVSVTNVLQGMYYNMYAGGTWDFIREYSNWDLYVFSKTESEVRENAGYAFFPDRDYFAYDFFGFLYIENAGDYTFELQSDDGSQLYIGSNMVIDYDGLHGAGRKASTAQTLPVGAIPITIKYFERTGGQLLRLRYSGPDTGGSLIEIPASQYRSMGTVPSITPPAAPTNLSATRSETEYRINLDWDYGASVNSVRFEVWRSTDNTNYQIVGNTEYGDLSFSDVDLQASQIYYYKINALNENGKSSQIGPASATTIGDNEAPTNPSNLVVEGVTSNSIVLSWDASTDNVGVTEYIIYMDGSAKGSIGGKQASAASALATTGSRTYTATGLSSDTEYSFYIVARDGVGNTSGNSNTALGKTSLGGPLPVELVSFEAYPGNGEVLLKWVTASELNNEKFLVERGTNAGNFVAIGGLDGAGTTSTRSEYKWIDRAPLDLAYYRIKQVDFDGTTSYSKTIRVVLDKSNLEELIVYPNPTNEYNINIRGFVPSNTDKVSVRLIDVMGKSYLNTIRDPNEFLSGIKIEPAQTLPVGVYILVLTDGTQVTQKRIVIR